MLATLLATAGPGTVTITPLNKAGLATWLEGQPPATAAWVKAVNFTAFTQAAVALSLIHIPGP
ncbi:leucyl aminopeptidase family protein, partial [Azospirillum brasilense]|nr:leucyl aminopeptidase family protein [Azospirillum argentinense]